MFIVLCKLSILNGFSRAGVHSGRSASYNACMHTPCSHGCRCMASIQRMTCSLTSGRLMVLRPPLPYGGLILPPGTRPGGIYSASAGLPVRRLLRAGRDRGRNRTLYRLTDLTAFRNILPRCSASAGENRRKRNQP